MMSYTINLAVIKQRREKLKLSQTDLTDALGLASVDQYFRRENGTYQFKAKELPALSEALDMPMENFFTQGVEKITKEATKWTKN